MNLTELDIRDDRPAPVVDLVALIAECHGIAVDHGWWPDGTRNVPELLCLLHSEISEALEEVRSGGELTDARYEQPDAKPCGFVSELVDVQIRLLDMVGGLGLTGSFIRILREKIEYNRRRTFRHGGKTA